jgi:hypothetical protein
MAGEDGDVVQQQVAEVAGVQDAQRSWYWR